MKKYMILSVFLLLASMSAAQTLWQGITIRMPRAEAETLHKPGTVIQVLGQKFTLDYTYDGEAVSAVTLAHLSRPDPSVAARFLVKLNGALSSKYGTAIVKADSASDSTSESTVVWQANEIQVMLEIKRLANVLSIKITYGTELGEEAKKL